MDHVVISNTQRFVIIIDIFSGIYFLFIVETSFKDCCFFLQNEILVNWFELPIK